MMPLADFVALSASLSNHSSRKSAELIVSSLAARGSCFVAEAAEVRAELEQIPRGRAGVSEVGSGGAMPRIGLHRARHLVHQPAEFVVGLGVARRVARELAAVLVVVGPLRQVVAVRAAA